ncbi:DUF3408 domain-containing protein [Rudanella paleaurantiibacter]|uniref:DUF3408 domain-containing protein n=1 Tax=Rudanella paleaurantiibacter TaxID=2614655 RepID=A0A7J5TTC3_9BACT|nr:DUF3408 domain-containing protein [Rudanella paleaurantiibacter]KAB7726891.1 DUF3408 domain-containing protein [Rudanella paleaurantiibacter]
MAKSKNGIGVPDINALIGDGSSPSLDSFIAKLGVNKEEKVDPSATSIGSVQSEGHQEVITEKSSGKGDKETNVTSVTSIDQYIGIYAIPNKQKNTVKHILISSLAHKRLHAIKVYCEREGINTSLQQILDNILVAHFESHRKIMRTIVRINIQAAETDLDL